MESHQSMLKCFVNLSAQKYNESLHIFPKWMPVEGISFTVSMLATLFMIFLLLLFFSILPSFLYILTMDFAVEYLIFTNLAAYYVI